METGLVNHADDLPEKDEDLAAAFVHRGEPAEVFEDPEQNREPDEEAKKGQGGAEEKFAHELREGWSAMTRRARRKSWSFTLRR